MRKLGCCTWIFGNLPLEQIADRVRAAGLDGVELFGDWQNLKASGVAEIFASRGLSIFSLTPADADISHPDPAKRQAGLDYYQGLIEFAAELGKPLMSCHGQVGRIRPIASQAEEDVLLVESVRAICAMAARRGVQVVFEILNRYETHQIRTIAEGLELLERVSAGNLRLLPDAYHMNIEERDPAAALRSAGGAVGLYHAADSNRCGVGQGNIDFAAQIEALDAVSYGGPIILEVNAPGPNPFTPDKGGGFRDVVSAQLSFSVARLRAMGT